MNKIKDFLCHYDGPIVRLMEVCGTHTAEISRNGIIDMLSDNIQLISGPGCPVCVTVTDYIDKLIELSKMPNHTIVSFGDMLRVPGSASSLSDVRADGGDVQIVYSPMDVLPLAQANPEQAYIFAAVGFETTSPIYAMLLEEAIVQQIFNVKLLTALKVMPPVIEWVCRQKGNVDGFLAPGHVSVIIGSDAFTTISEKYQMPFAIAGFEGEQMLAAIYALIKLRGKSGVYNLYPSAVTAAGNLKAQKLVAKFFEPTSAAWRGLGIIDASGLTLRPEYSQFDAGSTHLNHDHALNPLCMCAKILTGNRSPSACPLFGTQCTPQSPQGACMVSTEGSCYHYLMNHRK